MILATTALAQGRLGRPSLCVEYGTVGDRYVRRWMWLCGCSGELIGSDLMELACCDRHTRTQSAQQEIA